MVVSRNGTSEKAPKTRKFGGEIYERGICFPTKAEAEMSAQTSRKEGYKVRIVKYGKYYLYWKPGHGAPRLYNPLRL